MGRVLFLISLAFLFSLSTQAGTRSSKTFGVYAGASNCFGAYYFAGVGANVSNNVRLTLVYDYFRRVPQYSQPEVGVKWMPADGDFSPFIGLTTLREIQVGGDYTSSSGINVGIGYQAGFCFGFLAYFGKYF